MKQTTSDVAREARRSEAAPWLGHNPRPATPRHLRGSVDRTVVDNERLEPGRHRREHGGNRLGLVQRRQDDLDHPARLRGKKLREAKQTPPALSAAAAVP